MYITLILIETFRLNYNFQRCNIQRNVCNDLTRNSIDHFFAQHTIHSRFSFCFEAVEINIFSKIPFRKLQVLKFENGRCYLSELFIYVFPLTK